MPQSSVLTAWLSDNCLLTGVRDRGKRQISINLPLPLSKAIQRLIVVDHSKRLLPVLYQLPSSPCLLSFESLPFVWPKTGKMVEKRAVKSYRNIWKSDKNLNCPVFCESHSLDFHNNIFTKSRSKKMNQMHASSGRCWSKAFKWPLLLNVNYASDKSSKFWISSKTKQINTDTLPEK